MELQLALAKDSERAMELIDQAKAYFKKLSIDQWQRGYPDKECIDGDIQAKNGYFLCDAGKAIGYLCIDFAGEVSYAGLKGKWLTEGDYAVIHRMVIDDAYKGKGLSSVTFNLVAELCVTKGIHSIKADTDGDNAVMRGTLAKNGFEYCGTIFFDYGDKVAYEKVF